MCSDAIRYHIVVRARLEPAGHDWLDDCEVGFEGSHTHVRTPKLDQAALHGLLRRLRDHGITLISVQRDQPDDKG